VTGHVAQILDLLDSKSGMDENRNRLPRLKGRMTYRLTLTLNGVSRSLEVEPRTMLVHALRDGWGLTGAKIGCDTSQCGTCTVLLDGRAVKSCTVLALQAEGASLTTIEGLTTSDGLHPIQRAFRDHHGLQCGFCTPGMILTTMDLLTREAEPDEEMIRRALEGNLCRCTGYQTIVESVRAAAAAFPGPSAVEGGQPGTAGSERP
jgi:carbon-monoxide dehydrogenase small subunit